MKQLSIIVAVLESYEVVRRQLLHLERTLIPECELILIDDGSVPPLRAVWDSVRKMFAGTLHCTYDRRPWTQPKARNIGATIAESDKLLFFDIDHILTGDLLHACLAYTGDKLHWVRRPGILDESGNILTETRTLREYGMTDDSPSVHMNSFMIRRDLFRRLGGYDERFCGKYGGDDVDFHDRYEQLCRTGAARPAEIRGEGYVFPNPAMDVKKLFHSLPRLITNEPQINTDKHR
jgi:predicted glycosyltransferase involved in capsule biosynthesis